MVGIISIPAAALFLYACGPVETNVNEPVQLKDAAADNWIFANGWFSEWGGCNNAMDDDGDGLRDSHDPDCHVPGPMRDLSLAPFPISHNYFPNIALDLPGGPGYEGDFRDPAMTTRWLRFLSEPGPTAGINWTGPGINPSAVALPAALSKRVIMGSSAYGNNNDPDDGGLHLDFVDHSSLDSGAFDSPDAKGSYADASKRFWSTNKGYRKTQVPDSVGAAYTAQGPDVNQTGSQGASR